MATKLSAISKSDFEYYKKLYQYFDHEEYNFKRVYELDISYEKATRIPQMKLMECFFNLKVLDLSNNEISSFDPKPITKGVPQLEKLNLSSNKISHQNDVVKQGKLRKLQNVNLQDNPIIKNQHFHEILCEMIFPSLNNKADPVAISTATYTSIANKQEPPHWETIDERKFIYEGDKAVQDRVSQIELNEHAAYVLAQKNRDPETMKFVSYVDKECPYRKIGNFRSLLTMNERRIQIFDIFQISEYKDYKDIVINELEEKTKEKFKRITEKVNKGKVVEKPIKPLPEIQQIYLNRYEKRMRKEEEKFEPILHQNDKEAKEEENYLKVIHRMDQLNYDRREAKKHHNSNLAIWEKPAIDKYLESAEYLDKDNGQFAKQFNMLLEDLNKEGKELKDYKKSKEEYDKQMKAHYLTSLKRVYRFREFVDDTNFNKMFSKEKIEEIEREMQIYKMDYIGGDKMIDKPKRIIKKKELKLEYKDWELKTSSSEMSESSDDAEQQEMEKKDSDNFSKKMKTAKNNFSRKVTTFGEANVVQIEQHEFENDSNIENTSTTINKNLTSNLSLKNTQMSIKKTTFAEDATITQYEPSKTIHESQVQNKNVGLSMATIRTETGWNETIVSSESDYQEDDSPKLKSKARKVATIIIPETATESKKTPRKDSQNSIKSPRKSQTKKFDHKKQESNKKTGNIEEKTGMNVLLEKKKLAAATSNNKVPVINNSNTMMSQDISSFLQSNLSMQKKDRKKIKCHFQNFYNPKKDYVEKPMGFDKLLNYKIDKATASSRNINKPELSSFGKSNRDTNKDPSMRSIDKKSKDGQLTPNKDDQLFNSYQSKDGTALQSLNLHKKTTSAQPDQQSDPRNVKSARGKNYFSEDFMANTGVIDPQIIEEANQRFETENGEQKDSFIKGVDIVQQSYDQKGGEEGFIEGIDIIQQSPEKIEAEEYTSEHKQLIETVEKLEGTEQENTLDKIEEPFNEFPNLNLEENETVSQEKQDSTKNYEQSDPPVNFDVILKQMPDEHNLPSWRGNEADMMLQYQSQLDNTTKSKKTVGFNDGYEITPGDFTAWNTKKSTKQYQIKYGMQKSVSVPQNINTIYTREKYKNHDIGIGTNDFFRREAVRNAAATRQVNNVSWKGALRPKTSNYLNSKKKKVENDNTAIKVQAKGYERASNKNFKPIIKPPTKDLFVDSKVENSHFMKAFETFTDSVTHNQTQNNTKKETIGLQGFIPSFSEEKNYQKPIPRIINKLKSRDVNSVLGKSQYRQEDFRKVGKEKDHLTLLDLIPNEAEGWTVHQIQNLIDDDKLKGENLERYLRFLNKGDEQIQMYEDTKQALYFHRLRQRKIKVPVPKITYEDTLQILSKMYPKLNYLTKANQELQEIFLKVNNYDLPKNLDLTQVRHEILDESTPYDEKMRLAEYLQNTRSSKKKTGDSEKLWDKALAKDFNETQNNAILAAHYMKLKKYTTDGRFDKQIDKIRPMVEKSEGGVERQTGGIKKFNKLKMQGFKELDEVTLRKIENRIQDFTHSTFHDWEPRKFVNNVNHSYNLKKNQPFNDNLNKPKFNELMYDVMPSIDERLDLFHYKSPKLWTYDDEVDKMKWYFGNDEQYRGLTMEEKLSKYAEDFKEKADKAKNLSKLAEKEYIPDLDWKRREFDKEIQKQMRGLDDKEGAFDNYVKMIKDGKFRTPTFNTFLKNELK